MRPVTFSSCVDEPLAELDYLALAMLAMESCQASIGVANRRLAFVILPSPYRQPVPSLTDTDTVSR